MAPQNEQKVAFTSDKVEIVQLKIKNLGLKDFKSHKSSSLLSERLQS